MEHRGDSGRSEEKGRLVRSPQEASQRPSTSRWEGCRVLLRHGDEVKREWVINGQKRLYRVAAPEEREGNVERIREGWKFGS